MSRLAELRKAKGLTQRELAQRVKVSTQAICNYERGHRQGPVEKWQAIAKALGVKLVELFPDAAQ